MKDSLENYNDNIVFNKPWNIIVPALGGTLLGLISQLTDNHPANNLLAGALFVGISGAIAGAIYGAHRMTYWGAFLGWVLLALIIKILDPGQSEWLKLSMVLGLSAGAVIGAIIARVNIPPIKAWLLSFFRLGYGLIPVGDGKWLKQPVSAEYGKLIFSSSYFWPIGRLRAIPSTLHQEFFRRMRKLLLAKNILKALAAILALLPLLGSGLITSSRR